MAKQKVRIKKGIAYFPTFEAARDFGKKHCIGFPAWRVVEYEIGCAVQIRPGGDYLGVNGLPSIPKASGGA